MTPRAALVQLGKLVAKDMSSGHMGEMARGLGDALAADPDAILELLDMMVREGAKKKPSGPLIDAFAFMIGQALEVLRYQVERGFPEAERIVAGIRSKVATLVKGETLDPMLGIVIARQFAAAKLDLGDDLRDLMVGRMEASAATMTDMPSKADVVDYFTNLARDLGDDPFLIHGDMAETASAFPDERRAAMGAMFIDAPAPAVREAALGWLLDPATPVRRIMATVLAQAAGRGVVSDTMLRRMIAVRNWLPDDDRPALDEAIKACRQKGIACAAAPSVQVREVAASGFDGSGAQSIFVVVKAGRKHAVASLLVRHGFGVRDAWARHDLGKADADDFLWSVKEQVDLHEASMDYVLTVLPHFLAVGRMNGTPPPFGLLDFIETAGVANLNPEPLPVAHLVDRLLEEIPPARRTVAAVAKAVKSSRSWPDDHAFMASWFEDDATVDALLDGQRLSAARRTALVLEDLLPARRGRWAEALAWSALMLREGEDETDDWMDFAIVAGELLGDRPLGDIGLMHGVAKGTVESWRSRRG